MSVVSREDSIEKGPNDPFLVRAHHARNLSSLLRLERSPQEWAAAFERSAKSDPSVGSDQLYRDYFGHDTWERQATLDGFATYAQAFLDLPDVATVRFVYGQRDGLCLACANGQHCSQKGYKPTNNYDINTIRGIRDIARLQGIDEVITSSESDLSEAETIAQSVDLPSWAAKQILRYPNFDYVIMCSPDRSQSEREGHLIEGSNYTPPLAPIYQPDKK